MVGLFRFSSFLLNLHVPLPGSHTLVVNVAVEDRSGGSGHRDLPPNACRCNSCAQTEGRLLPSCKP